MKSRCVCDNRLWYGLSGILVRETLFGSDWPVITPDRWLSDFSKLEIRDEIRPKVLKANARKLLGI